MGEVLLDPVPARAELRLPQIDVARRPSLVLCTAVVLVAAAAGAAAGHELQRSPAPARSHLPQASAGARDAEAVVAALSQARGSDRSALASASDAAAQARAAVALAAAYGTADAELAAGPATRQTPALLRRIASAASAYRSLGRAARARNASRFVRAERGVLHADAEVDAALRRVR